MRARVFWIALPIAVVFALWVGPGLGQDDEMPAREPMPSSIERATPPVPEPEVPEAQCEPTHDPGPDGDR
ncbi:MAG: hypothetical protein NTY35_03775 [Planctomycetota bacterium]|nr:hypothetical protein [Planctomycetota bacterium]